MWETPFTFELNAADPAAGTWDNHIVRRLSSMRGQYHDADAYEALSAREDRVLYEVFEIRRPEIAGELLQGVTVIHPGKVGDEYFMTKGHFHQVLETGETYQCLRGEGAIVLENPEGETSVQRFRPGQVVYILPRWAHRSVNLSVSEDLVFFYVCPANAGHDYGTIEQQGFRKLIVERDGQPTIIDNPRWKSQAN